MKGLFIQGIQIDADVALQIADVKAHGRFFRRNLFQLFLGHGVNTHRLIIEKVGQIVHAVLTVVLQLVSRFDHVKGQALGLHMLRRHSQHRLALLLVRRIAQHFLADEHDARHIGNIRGPLEKLINLLFRYVAVIRRPQDDVEPAGRNGLGVSRQDSQIRIAQSRHGSAQS